MNLLINYLITDLVIFVLSAFVPQLVSVGAWTSGYINAFIAALLIGLVNWTVGNILRALSMPVNVMTLWLVSFLITLLSIWLVDKFLPGFDVQNSFIWYVIFALIIAAIAAALGWNTIKK